MTNKEFSDEFDLLVAAQTELTPVSLTNPLLFNEYEKSVFLTEAQEDTAVALYNGTTQLGSFESTEEMREYLSNLIRTELHTFKPSITKDAVALPKDCLFIVYEEATLGGDSCSASNSISVLPVTHDTYTRVKNNPFRAGKQAVLRLNLNDNKVLLDSAQPIESYLVRYIKKPQPIVLQDFTGVSINGVSKETPCELNSILHRTILEKAVTKALAIKIKNNNNKTTN